MIHRKWKIYKKALRCMQGGDSAQQLIVFTSRTEFVKFVFLFIMNLVELFGLLCTLVIHIIDYIRNKPVDIYNNISNHTSGHTYFFFPKHFNKTYTIFFSHTLPNLHNIFFVMCIIIFASLCTYLSARYAQKSWIKSNIIPYLIGFFLLYEIIIQILASFCTTFIIASWCDNFLLIASLVIAFKKYHELVMIINWSIVDLRTSNSILLLKRQINMKQTFIKSIKFLRMGAILLIIAEIIETISHTLVLLLRENNTSSFQCLSLCGVSYFSNPHALLIISVLSYISTAISIIGASFVLIPYTGFGLSTMCVILWRLIRGKTGYKTHFHNDFSASLIRK